MGYGSDGYVKKPSGREIKNLVYIMLEYIQGGLLFDVCDCGFVGLPLFVCGVLVAGVFAARTK